MKCDLRFVNLNQLSVKREAGLYHQVDQHSCDIQQGVDDHEVGQEGWAEFECKPYEEGEGQEHAKAPEEVAAVEDGGQEHVLGGEEEGGDEPGEPAVDLFGEAWHGIGEVGGEFSEGDGEWKKETQDEHPCWNGTEEHVRGDHGVAEDGISEGFTWRSDDGHGNDAETDEPEQVLFPCGA